MINGSITQVTSPAIATLARPKKPSDRADGAPDFGSLMGQAAEPPQQAAATNKQAILQPTASVYADGEASAPPSEPPLPTFADRGRPGMDISGTNAIHLGAATNATKPIGSDRGSHASTEKLNDDESSDSANVSINDPAVGTDGDSLLDLTAIGVLLPTAATAATGSHDGGGRPDTQASPIDGEIAGNRVAISSADSRPSRPGSIGTELAETTDQAAESAADSNGVSHHDDRRLLSVNAPNSLSPTLSFGGETSIGAAAPDMRPDFSAQRTAPGIANALTIDLARTDAWIATVANDLASLKSPADTLHFRLHPATLGTMDVALRQDDGQTLMVLQVETIAAHQMLSESKSRLFEAAAGNGVDINSLQIQLGSGGHPDVGQRARQPNDHGSSRPIAGRHNSDANAEHSVSDVSLTTITGAPRYRFA